MIFGDLWNFQQFWFPRVRYAFKKAVQFKSFKKFTFRVIRQLSFRASCGKTQKQQLALKIPASGAAALSPDSLLCTKLQNSLQTEFVILAKADDDDDDGDDGVKSRVGKVAAADDAAAAAAACATHASKQKSCVCAKKFRKSKSALAYRARQAGEASPSPTPLHRDPLCAKFATENDWSLFSDRLILLFASLTRRKTVATSTFRMLAPIQRS